MNEIRWPAHFAYDVPKAEAGFPDARLKREYARRAWQMNDDVRHDTQDILKASAFYSYGLRCLNGPALDCYVERRNEEWRNLQVVSLCYWNKYALRMPELRCDFWDGLYSDRISSF